MAGKNLTKEEMSFLSFFQKIHAGQIPLAEAFGSPKGIAEAIVAQDTDSLDRSQYILKRAVEYLSTIDKENATLRAWRDKQHNSL